MTKKAEVHVDSNEIFMVSECCTDVLKTMKGEEIKVGIPKAVKSGDVFEIPAQQGFCSWCKEEHEVLRVALRVF